MKSLTIPLVLAFSTALLNASVDPPSLQAPHIGQWAQAIRKAHVEFQQHRLTEAAASANRALRLAKHFGDSDDRLAVTYYLLGDINRDWGHCSKARSGYSDAIAVWEKQSDPRHQYLFNSTISLLGTLCECDQFDTARKTLREFEPKLQLWQHSSMDKSRLLAVRAVIARAHKEYHQAEAYYRQSIQLMTESGKATTLQIAGERANLALVIGKDGRPAESLAESEDVISLLDHDGMRSVTFVVTLNNAACALAALGRRDEAERMFERAVDAARTNMGDDNRFTAKVMLNYASVLRKNKETPEADAMQQKGLEIFRRAAAEDSATVDVQDLRQLPFDLQ